ncbi:MAG TPA: DAK2 domain-containing protein [Negativicutes bacterium]|nr:DAK2 domain-containing protein [Negativicutes bacterium]
MEKAREVISGADFRRMIIGSYGTFLREYEAINRLNVFPVPDGDTGTNMLLTLQAVVRTLQEASDSGIGPLAKRAADSALMGARGNSGVILSQIFRGLSRGLRGKETARNAEIGKAFQYGILYAYRAVAKPMEGTILTVAKGIAKGAHRALRDNRSLEDVLREAVRAGRKELDRTPQLLPALAAAGVVDAGGLGLIVFIEGCLEGLSGECVAPVAELEQELRPASGEVEQADPTHPYCTEFLVKNCTINARAAQKVLQDLGVSLITSDGDGLLKVHIHTAHPGAVLELATAWGALSGIKIDNMLEQNERFLTARAVTDPVAVISVAAGAGLIEIMKKLGAQIVISGGQTMNPPVEDFVAAIHQGQARQYIILPNNRNILLAASQVKKILGDRVLIVPTTNIPQGTAALLGFDPALTAEVNAANMQQRAAKIRAGAVTQAVRDSMLAGRVVPEGRWIGVVDNKVLCDGDSAEAALFGLLAELVQPDSELVTLYTGGDIDEVPPQMLQDLREHFPKLEVETYPGGQPYYHFIVGVE